ncbi:hypothetical protein DAEQUDRAFT_815861 [Daedalea quercina L-15889]|uniref:Protein kinase domain-containing protein n=1 Tax=Daedalea quercina L-15889 TaxID=1314783 RepID=A0A165KEB8_9APHY|nr:hypothetical protein DAEQUDRAFT_815861 [Daedalea quercina L-15889]
MPQRDPQPETIPEMSPDRERKNITQYFYAYDYLPMLDTPEYSPRGKTHSRLVMETYGWSIKYALSLVELVQAVKDALKGYQAAYQKNVIHRDMSVENILITRLTEEGKRGVIIDFDYAKVLGDPTLYGDPASGTRPFMSGELLIGRPYYNAVRREVDGVQVVVFDDSAPRHAFYHDLESALWILLWICLSKSGGGIRRHALVHKTDDSLDRLFRGLYEVPEIEQLGRSKREVLKDEMEFSYAIRYIDDFYRPLESFLWKLWHILHTGYKTHDFRFEETFPRFLSAFDEAEQLLKDSPPPTLTEGQLANVDKERQRRGKDEVDWQHSPRPVLKTTRQPMRPVIQENQDENLDDDDAFADETRDSSPTPGADAANLDDLGRRPARLQA